jgi:carbonic anhydrase
VRFQKRVKNAEARRAELARGQAPFAAVLGCADSRTAPEILFDAGLGKLFVVRVAGNVANVSSVASIEYAVANLGTRLVVVLAHESCGAVAAALAGGDAGKNLNCLLGHIKPAIDAPGENEVNTVARRNAQQQAEKLLADSEILRNAVEHDGLRIVTAFHNFTSGAVDFDQSRG